MLEAECAMDKENVDSQGKQLWAQWKMRAGDKCWLSSPAPTSQIRQLDKMNIKLFVLLLLDHHCPASCPTNLTDKDYCESSSYAFLFSLFKKYFLETDGEKLVWIHQRDPYSFAECPHPCLKIPY